VLCFNPSEAYTKKWDGFSQGIWLFSLDFRMSDPSKDVTALLTDVSAGKEAAWNRLLSVVYQELRALAHGAMRKARPGQTLQTTALVHEVYLRLVRDKEERWKNRTHFFSVAAKAMRQILVDKYRSWKALKRGQGQGALSLNEVEGWVHELGKEQTMLHDLEALDEALNKLESRPKNQRKCTIVELRFFVGLTYKEIAEVLGVSMATVTRDWEFTKAWLFQELSGTD
jgi:RNA polymerase sigma factor (TIGR02999 family)